MSILIKGMEMPKNCWECPLQEYGNCFANGDRPIDKSIIADSRDDSCPLVQVQPHGDLIDRREAIIDANERAYDFWLSDDEVNATIQFLKEQPTILSAEEET